MLSEGMWLQPSKVTRVGPRVLGHYSTIVGYLVLYAQANGPMGLIQAHWVEEFRCLTEGHDPTHPEASSSPQ